MQYNDIIQNSERHVFIQLVFEKSKSVFMCLAKTHTIILNMKENNLKSTRLTMFGLRFFKIVL